MPSSIHALSILLQYLAAVDTLQLNLQAVDFFTASVLIALTLLSYVAYRVRRESFDLLPLQCIAIRCPI